MAVNKQETVDPEKARDDLLDKFQEQQNALTDSRKYYEAERRPDAIGLAIPSEMEDLLAHVGHPRLYVDAVAERQELQGFRLGGKDEADEELWDWWQANNLDIESTLGNTDALIYGRSYITVAAPIPDIDIDVDPDVPIIRVEPPTSLYAKIDPRSRKVSQAIRAIYDDAGEDIIASTLYLPDQTVIWEKVDGEWEAPQSISHGLGVVPVVPIPNRTRLSDLYGTSEITPELRSVTDASARILMLLQGAAELMGVPLRVFFGIDPRELGVDPVTGQKNYDAYLARILGFGNPGGKGYQFDAAELRNFVDALDALDRKAAQYTGLPPQYLSSGGENPASADAIKASETRLVKKCERKNKVFGSAWEEAMRLAYRIGKGGDVPPEYYRMEAIWADPSTPTYAAKADAASKLYGNGNGVIPKEQARIDMGYTATERMNQRKWDEEDQALGLGLVGTMYGQSPTARTTPAAPQPDSTTKAVPA